MIYTNALTMKRAIRPLESEGATIYCVMKGRDDGGSSADSIITNLIAYTTTLDEALTLYASLCKLQAANSIQPLNKDFRYYCYLKSLDLSLPLRRHNRIKGITETIGYKSHIIWQDNYTENPENHPDMITIHNNVRYDWKEIVDNGLCSGQKEMLRWPIGVDQGGA